MSLEVEKLEKQLEKASGTERVDVLNKLSGAYFNQSQTLSLGYSKEALDLARETSYRLGETTALRGIGNIFYRFGDFAEALPNYQASLEIEKEINNVPMIAGTLNNIALIHALTGDLEKALEVNLEALKLLEGTDEKDRVVRIVLNSIGNNYMQLEDYNKSLEFFKRSLSICEESGDLEGVAFNLNNIALLCQKQGKFVEALEYYQKTLDIRRKLKHKHGLASTLLKMGNCIMESGEMSSAREYLEEGIQIADEENFKDLVKDGLKWIGIILEREGKYKEALDFYKRSSELRETIYSEEHSQAIARMQSQFDLKQKTIEIESLEASVIERAEELARKNEELEREIAERKQADDKRGEAFKELKISQTAALSLAEDLTAEITERKQAEEALRKSETQLSNALQIAHLGPWEYDTLNDLFTFNDHFYTIFHTTAEQVGGYTMSSAEYAKRFVHPDDAKLVGAAVGEAIESEDPDFSLQLEHRIIYADGGIGYITVRFFIIKDENGRTIRTYGVNQDVTERKQLEEQFRQSQKMEGIGRLAGGVAHDFNNLLTVINGHAELAMSTLDVRDPLREYLQLILKAGDKAASLTQQLLAFSRKQTLQIKVLNLNTVIISLDKMLQRVIGEDIELVTKSGKELWNVEADPGQISQIIINLAVNARDAVPDGGKLTIETQNVKLDEEYAATHPDVTPGQYVMLAISDTGAGMTDEVKAQIFEPFFTTKGEGKGTGLGLSTVYGIVKQSGGSIWIYSELGVGTTFKIYLPMVSEKEDKLTLKPDYVELPRGTETILVVEDEDGVRKLTCRTLKQLGYKVIEAENGGEALMICKELEKPVDLVLTDVIMPKVSGAVLIKNLQEIWSDFKVLYMSGYTANAIAHSGILDHDKPYLQKPFRPIDLAKKVRSVLDE